MIEYVVNSTKICTCPRLTWHFFSIILMWNSDAIRWCFIYDNIHVSIKQIVLLNEKEKNQQTWNGYSIYLMFD